MRRIAISSPLLLLTTWFLFSVFAIDNVSADMSMLVPLTERLATLKERNKITVEQHTVIVNDFGNEELLNAKIGDHDGLSYDEAPKLDEDVADAFRVWLHEEVADGDMTEFMANHLRGLFRLGPPPNYQSVPLSKQDGPVWANYSGNGVVQFLARSKHANQSNYNGIWGYHKGSREYALHCHSQGIYILDVTDADSGTIVKLQFIGMAGGKTWRDVATEGDYAYVAAQDDDAVNANLWVIHLAELSGDVPQAVDSKPISSSNIKQIWGYKNLGHTVNVWNGLLFLNSARKEGCKIFDVATDPMSPVVVGDWLEGDCHDSFAKQISQEGEMKDFLFTADGADDLFRIIDITDIRNDNYEFNQIGATENLFAYAHQNVVSDDDKTLFVFEETNQFDIAAFDISDLTDPQLITKFQWSGDGETGNNSLVHNGFVRGNFLYVAYYGAGLRVFDISDLYNIIEVGKLETYRDPDSDGDLDYPNAGAFTGAWNVYVDLPSGKVLISDSRGGLYVVQIDEDATPAPGEPPTRAPVLPPATCRSLGGYVYLKKKFCHQKMNQPWSKYARFWEVRSGTKQEVLNRVCSHTPCSIINCCQYGPARKCSNTGDKGLIGGGFTQQMCGKNQKLRPKSKLKKMACTGKNGARCMKKNCCRKA